MQKIRLVTKYSIALFYFVLGFVFVFPSVNIWLFLKERTHLDPGKLALEMQIVDFPWLLKPIYAWFSDRFPIWGYRRKTYVGLFSLYCAIAWFLLPLSTPYLGVFYLVLTIENLCLCIADVAVDALIIERVKKEETEANEGTLQSICATCRSLGKCTGSVMGAILFAEGVSSNGMFYLTGVAPLCVTFASFWISEQRAIPDDVKTLLDKSDDFEKELETGKKTKDWKFYIKSMFDGFVKTDMWKFCMVATIYIIVPDPGNAYFYYYQDVMKMPDFELQVLSLAHELGMLAGNFLFVIGLRKSSPRKLMTTSTLVVTTAIMLQAIVIFLANWNTHEKVLFVYAYEFFTAIADVFLFMPLAVMSAKLTSEGVEGTTYSLVLSIQNLGGFLDNLLSSQIMNTLGISGGNMDHIWYMSFISAFFFLAPLTVLHILPEKALINEKEEK